MIIRIKNHKAGVVDYLKSGEREDSEYTRDEKDKVINIAGDLDLVEKIIKYTNKYKRYKNSSYQHITISFTEEDFEKFYNLEIDAYDFDKIQELTDEFVKLYLAGYDENEYTYYAELHYPKIKEEHDKIRLAHIHIVLPLLNLVSNTKLKTPLFSVKTNDLLQTYIAKKHNLDLPINYQKPENERNVKPLSKEGLKRKELQELLKDIKTERELLQFFKKNNLQYRKVETKRNCYYKIINPAGKNINLRGRGLEHLEEIAKYGVVKNLPKERISIAEKHAQMSLSELEKEISEYVKKRIKEVGERRSRKATVKVLKLREQQKERFENTISTYEDIKKTLSKANLNLVSVMIGGDNESLRRASDYYLKAFKLTDKEALKVIYYRRDR